MLKGAHENITKKSNVSGLSLLCTFVCLSSAFWVENVFLHCLHDFSLGSNCKDFLQVTLCLSKLNFACSSCDFKTGTKFNLERHNVTCKKSMESLPSEKSCKQCRKTFSTQKALERHTKVHNKDKPDVPNTTVSCTVCQKTFAKSWNLKRH